MRNRPIPASQMMSDWLAISMDLELAKLAASICQRGTIDPIEGATGVYSLSKASSLDLVENSLRDESIFRLIESGGLIAYRRAVFDKRSTSQDPLHDNPTRANQVQFPHDLAAILPDHLLSSHFAIEKIIGATIAHRGFIQSKDETAGKLHRRVTTLLIDGKVHSFTDFPMLSVGRDSKNRIIDIEECSENVFPQQIENHFYWYHCCLKFLDYAYSQILIAKERVELEGINIEDDSELNERLQEFEKK